MSNELRTPRSPGTAIELGNRLWRTQLLPLGEIDYKGRKIKFDKEYLSGLIRAFKAKAFDLVPFQLAPDDNKHTNDPERFRGEIVGLEMTGDGLDLLLEPTEAGEELLRTNPKLGVSARIYEEYQRSDGKAFPQALQHVLATLDPRVPGMRTWQEVEVPVALSQQIGEVEVVDLSDAQFGDTEGGTDKVAFSKEDREALIELLKKARGAKDDELEGLVDELVADSEVGDEEELSDEELDRLLAEAELEDNEGEEETEEEDEEVEEPALDSGGRQTVAASNGRRSRTLELAQIQLGEQSDQITAMQAVLDDQAYTAERENFARVLGIPPKIVDFARPLLEGSGHVVDLAGGDQVDAGAVMRRVLTELGKQIKLLDLSSVIGSGLEDDEEKEEEERSRTETADFVKAARSTFGL